MAKLTETTKDQLQANGGQQPAQVTWGAPAVAWMPVQQSMPVGQSLGIPQPIIEPPKKRGRKPKKVEITEQTMNVAPVVQQQPLKIALIGTAPSSRMLAPYNDPSWEIWCCSPGNMNQIPRATVWFEIHGTNLLEPENKHYGEPYIAWLKRQTIPVYMQDNILVPNATPYPMKEMVKKFGPYYFTSSFSWMMALAIDRGATEIALYGIDMASKDEYILQRPGAYYFMMEAAKVGCKMWAPYESDIMQPPPLYGWSDVGPYGRKMRARTTELKARINEKAQLINGATHEKVYLEGALENQDYVISIQGGVQDNSDIGYLDELLAKARSQR